jgi:hypothetical protein
MNRDVAPRTHISNGEGEIIDTKARPKATHAIPAPETWVYIPVIMVTTERRLATLLVEETSDPGSFCSHFMPKGRAGMCMPEIREPATGCCSEAKMIFHQTTIAQLPQFYPINRMARLAAEAID